VLYCPASRAIWLRLVREGLMPGLSLRAKAAPAFVSVQVSSETV
jgi:hypothetical protein